jgi:uncharacterized protein (DUF2141 family)
MKYWFSVFFLFCILCAKSQTCTISVVCQNFDNNKGTAKIALYSAENKKYFLSNTKFATQKKESKIFAQKALFEFTEVPYGTYAIAVQHDENNDGIFNRAVIGFPLEGYGISGNETIFGKPSFEDCDFVVNSAAKKLIIEMKYFKL